VNDRILVVGCGFPQLSLLRTAKRMGLFVVGADVNPRAVGVKHCDEFFEVSAGDVDGLCVLLARTCPFTRTRPPSGRARTRT
jgi:hypothetical protein